VKNIDDASPSRARIGERGGTVRRIPLIGLTLALAGALTACSSGQNSAAQLALQKTADTYAIEQLEVKWHEASSTKNVDLMMTIWADDATLTIGSKTLTGHDQIRDFFANSAAPFKPENHWVSETPAYKIRVTVDGDKGTLYFECHYVDAITGKVAAIVSADQDVARINGRWVITKLVAATPELMP
jgi:ketosteroid isomerase-like protein